MTDGKLSRRKHFLIGSAVFFILTAPTLYFGFYYYNKLSQDITSKIFLQVRTLAGLSAASLEVRLNRLVGVAENIASESAFKSKVSGKQWDGAIKIIEDLTNEVSFYDPYVDRIKLMSPDGVVRGAFPRLYGGIGEQDSSFISEWSQPLLKDRKRFYVSNVHRRVAIPRINVVEVMVPVVDRSADIVGILSLQVPINNFSDFGKDIEVGTSGFAYFVDRTGQIIAHPKYSAAGPIIDFSRVPSVSKVIRGEEGVEILYNPIERQERISAYKQVPVFGWGVVAQEPTAEAFESRDSILNRIALDIILFCLINLLSGVAVFIGLEKRKIN